MLETIHEYARERLEASGEAEVLSQRHAQYFLELAKTAAPEVEGPQSAQWLQRLECEHGNFRAALQMSLTCGDAERALALSGALGHFWLIRGHIDEGRQWLEAAVSKGSEQASRAVAWALTAAGEFARLQGDFVRAKELRERALAVYRELEDVQGVAMILHDLGNLATDQGAFDQGMALHEESLALRREQGAPWPIAHSLTSLGYVAMFQGNYERAEALLDEGTALWRQLQQPSRLANSLVTLSYVAVDRAFYERARTLLAEVLTLYKRLGEQTEIAVCLEAFAALAAGTRQPERAARLWGAAEVLRETLGYPRPPAEQVYTEHRVATIRAQLDEATWQQAWAEGRAMSLKQSIAYALEDAPAPRAGN